MSQDTICKVSKYFNNNILKFKMEKKNSIEIDSIMTQDKPSEIIVKFKPLALEKESNNQSKKKQKKEQKISNDPIVYILPTQYTLTIGNVNQIDIENTKADVNALLSIAVFYGDLIKEEETFNLQSINKQDLTKYEDQKIQWYSRLRNMMVVELSHKENINLNDKDVQFTHHTQNKMLLFRIRKDFGAILCQDVFCTPFQNLHIVFSIRIQDINISPGDKEENKWKVNQLTKIKFNLLKFEGNAFLSPDNMGTQIYFADELNIGQYQVNTKKTYCENSMYRFPYQIADRMKLKNLKYNDKDIAKSNILSSKRKQAVKEAQSANKDFTRFQEVIQRSESIFTFPEQEQEKKGLLQIKDKITIQQNKNGKQDEKKKGEQDEKKKGEQDDKKIEENYKIRSFNYAHISITLFHHPTVTVLTTLFPLITIALINLACFLINPSQGDWDVKKLTAIVTAIVAYIGLIPVVRKQIPPTENPTIIEIMVFIELLPSIGAIIQMLHYQNMGADIPTYTAEYIALGLVPTIIVLSYCILSLAIYLILTYCCRRNISHFQMVDPGLQVYFLKRELWNNHEYNRYIKMIQKQRQQISKQLANK